MESTRLVTLTVLAAFASLPSAFAHGNLMSACKSDLKKAGCSAKTEADAFKCIEKHEKEGKKDEGLSADCHKAHEAYEKKMGKEEKGENHEEHES